MTTVSGRIVTLTGSLLWQKVDDEYIYCRKPLMTTPCEEYLPCGKPLMATLGMCYTRGPRWQQVM